MQRDLYPSLLLFPAERKKAVPYGGEIAVSEILNFIADHASNSERLFRENGNYNSDFSNFLALKHLAAAFIK